MRLFWFSLYFSQQLCFSQVPWSFPVFFQGSWLTTQSQWAWYDLFDPRRYSKAWDLCEWCHIDVDVQSLGQFQPDKFLQHVLRSKLSQSRHVLNLHHAWATSRRCGTLSSWRKMGPWLSGLLLSSWIFSALSWYFIVLSRSHLLILKWFSGHKDLRSLFS